MSSVSLSLHPMVVYPLQLPYGHIIGIVWYGKPGMITPLVVGSPVWLMLIDYFPLGTSYGLMAAKVSITHTHGELTIVQTISYGILQDPTLHLLVLGTLDTVSSIQGLSSKGICNECLASCCWI